MNNISLFIDIAVVLLIWIIAITGYKKGLVKMLCSVLSFVGAAILTAYLYKPLSQMFLKIKFVQNFNNKITDNVVSQINKTSGDVSSLMPSWMSEFVENLINTAGQTISQGILQILVSIAAAILIYILVKLALGLFAGILNFIMKLPILDIVNRAGGLFLGIIKGVIIVLIIFALISLLVPMGNYKEIHTMLLNTNIAKYFYNNNLLMKLILKG